MTPSRRGARRAARLLVLAMAVYLALAYLVLPIFWRHYEHLPVMESMPKITHGPDGLVAEVPAVADKGDIGG